MRELGRILRSTRESLGFDLEQIEEKTKIRKRYLLALEDGDWSVLPGRVYARGFVRSYAEVLGLDGLELLQTYVDGREIDEPSPGATTSRIKQKEPPNVSSRATNDSVAQPVEPAQPREAKVGGAEPYMRSAVEPNRTESTKRERPARTSPTRSVGTGAVQVVVIVAALAIVAGGWWAIGGHHSRHAPQTVTGLNTTNQSATTTTNQPVNVTNSVNAAGSNTANAITNATGTSTPAPSATITAQPMQGTTATYLVKNVTQLKVNLQVVTSEPCWIRVLSDGKIVDGNDVVNPNQSRNFEGDQTVVLNLGHVQGVQINVNGKPLTLPNSNSPVTIQLQKQ